MFVKNFIWRNLEVDPADGGGTPPVKIDHQNPTPPPTYTPPEFKIDMVPPEFRDKPYMKDVKDIPTLFKNYDGLQTQMGQRPPVGVPDANAKPEDVDKFYGTLRAKTAAEYKYEDVKGADGKPIARDTKVVEKINEAFLGADLSPRQAAKLLPKLEAMVGELGKEHSGAEDAAFEASVTKMFGDKTAEALKIAKDLMVAHIPAEFKDRLEKLPNDALMFLTATLKGVHDKYIKEDSINSPGGGGSNVNEAELRAEAQGIMKSDAYKDFRHADHQKVQDRLNVIYNAIAGIPPLPNKD
jgi:hypothetical protein